MMDYDLVIVGGGMVGAAFALALEQTSLRIALLDAAVNHTEDARLIALNHSSYVLFNNLQLWPALAEWACAIHQVHVSNRGHFGTTQLTAKELQLHALGYVVPAKHINASLYAQLEKSTHIDLLRPAKLTDLTQEQTHATLTIQKDTEKQMLTAKIVIAADGTYSTVRELLNIPTEIIDYKQKAIVTITALQRSHQHIAYERFLPNGAIAMLPLDEQRMATIWSGEEKAMEQLLQLPDSDFLAQLQQEFGYRLGQFQKTYPRFSYPLKLVKAKKQIDSRVLLLGNAAHTIHPIAAQGLNLALYEVAVVAEHLSSQNADTLSLEHLPNYLEQQNSSIQLSHYMTRLFSADFFALNAVRQIGMIGLDMCPLAKQRFAQQVLGKIGPLPKLLRTDTKPTCQSL